jgi:hypothetical protein
MKYFIICQDAGSILAIHKTKDSAEHCFRSIINKGDFDRFLYLQEMDTDGYGMTKNEATLLTYSKISPLIIFNV